MDLSISAGIEIAPGVVISRLGLGTYKSQPGAEVESSVAEALKLGYRHVDTAALYANEAGVGQAVRASGIPRDEVFLTTKVWNDDQGYDGTLAALRRSLTELGVDQVDLYLVHWPMRAHMEGTWRAMEDALADGLVRSIGVCNFLPHHLEGLLRIAEVPPAVDQVEFHPRLQQAYLQTYLAENGITLEAWAPIMRGRVAEIPEIVRIAERLGKTPAQVAIRWALELGYVVIPKSVHAERIAENADVFDFELTEGDHREMAALDDGTRIGADPDTYAW